MEGSVQRRVVERAVMGADEDGKRERVGTREEVVWLARYVHEGREISRQFRDERRSKGQRRAPKAGDELARAWLDAEFARIARGEWVGDAAGRVTVGELADQWLTSKVRLRASTRTLYRGVLAHQVLPTWGRVPVAKVRHADVATWVATMAASGLSGSRIRHAYVVLHAVLEYAVRTRRAVRNEATGVELPPMGGAPKRPLTAAEVWALADAAHGIAGAQGRLSVLVLAWCGLRASELAGLRVRHFNELVRTLRVEETLVELGGRLTASTPKTAAGTRTVPLPSWLARELAELTVGKAPSERLFTAPDGGPLRLRNWRARVFDPAVKAAGIASQAPGDRVTPHALRHTTASLHAAAGTPVLVLSKLLGHSKPSVTSDIYSHLYEGDAARHVEALGAAAEAALADWRRTGNLKGGGALRAVGSN